jgi:TatA/E family protein of Tat protein translocase
MLSIPHLIVIFIVALVVFGPEKLPELARNLGKIMGEVRRATNEVRGTFEEHMRDLEREAQARQHPNPEPAQPSGSAPPAPSTPVPAEPETQPDTEKTSDGHA